MTIDWSRLDTLSVGLSAVSNRMKMRLEKQAGWSSKEVEEMLAAEVRTELRMEADAMGSQALSEQIYKTMNMQLPLSHDIEVQPSMVDEIDESWWVVLLVLAAFAFGVLMGSIG